MQKQNCIYADLSYFLLLLISDGAGSIKSCVLHVFFLCWGY